MTKGLRDKRLPVIEPIGLLLRHDPPRRALVYQRRPVAEGRQKPLLADTGLVHMIAEYQRRCRHAGTTDAKSRLALRQALMREAGALTYTQIQSEFKRIARRLQWPAQATLKDFRHLFSTAMANGGMPEHERRYLMGHAPGKEAIVAYTHLNKLAEHYHQALERELGAALQVLRSRLSSPR